MCFWGREEHLVEKGVIILDDVGAVKGRQHLHLTNAFLLLL
jgi:hypothetical protein